MKKTTADIVRAAVLSDETVTSDQRDAAIAVLHGRTGELPMLLTAAQSARALSVSRSTFWRMCQAGTINAVCIRGMKRYRREDVMRLAGLP